MKKKLILILFSGIFIIISCQQKNETPKINQNTEQNIQNVESEKQKSENLENNIPKEERRGSKKVGYITLSNEWDISEAVPVHLDENSSYESFYKEDGTGKIEEILLTFHDKDKYKNAFELARKMYKEREEVPNKPKAFVINEVKEVTVNGYKAFEIESFIKGDKSFADSHDITYYIEHNDKIYELSVSSSEHDMGSLKKIIQTWSPEK